jgi:uncharacterized membrane protein
MSATRERESAEERIAKLEHELLLVSHRLSSCDGRLRRLEGSASNRAVRPAPRADELVVLTRPRPQTPATPRMAAPARKLELASVGDLVGGRWLAWIGGIATLLGIVLFLALAISHGWIGEVARVVLAGVGAASLVAGGAWLRGRRGSTEVAVVMVGTGTAGLFATLLVASTVYELIPAGPAVAGAMLVGGVATTLAIRWAGAPIASIGLLGALASPLLVGAPNDGTTILTLLLATGCALAVVVWQRWTWLAVATPLIGAPQWANWLLSARPVGVELVVVAGFTALGLAGAIGAQLRSPKRSLQPACATLLVLNACIAAVVGYVGLENVGSATTAELWLVALSLVHAALGLARHRRLDLPRRGRELLIALAVILADVAFGLRVDGVILAVGWGVAAVAFAWLTRVHARDTVDEALIGLGVGAHVGLVLLRTFLAAPLADLGDGGTDIAGVITIAVLAATCIAGGRAIGSDRRLARGALDALGLAAIAYLTASTFQGAVLVAVWAFEAAALAELHRRAPDAVSAGGAGAFIAAALIHALLIESPPGSLLTGAPSAGAAAIALGAIAIALARAGRALPGDATVRQQLFGASAITALFLVSVVLVGAFQPTGAGSGTGVLDLTVRQLGQVLLSGLWSVVGLTTLIIGLRRRRHGLRIGGLALLLVTAGKVFVYDLSTLTSIYRVLSFIVLGLLLLAAASAYQRMRPMDQR